MQVVKIKGKRTEALVSTAASCFVEGLGSSQNVFIVNEANITPQVDVACASTCHEISYSSAEAVEIFVEQLPTTAVAQQTISANDVLENGTEINNPTSIAEPVQVSHSSISLDINETAGEFVIKDSETLVQARSPNTSECMTIEELGTKVNIPSDWFKNLLSSCVEFFKIKEMAVVIKLTIDDKFGTSLKIFNRNVNMDHAIYQELPNAIKDDQTLLTALASIDNWVVCCGNGEDNLKNEYLSRKRRSGYICEATRAVRASKCILISKRNSKSPRCFFCRVFRAHLRSLVCKQKKRLTKPQTQKLKFKSMQNEFLIQKLKQAKKIQAALRRKVNRYQKKISTLIKNDGVKLDKLTSLAFEELLKKHVNTETELFTKQFLLEQIKMLDKDPKARRFHPSIIKFCVYMRAKSPAAYKALHESGALILPSERTLYNYTSRLLEKPGLTKEAFREFAIQFRDISKDEHQKYVCLSIDEIKVRQDVVYHKATGEISGFVQLNDFLDNIRDLEKSCAAVKSSTEKLDLASHVLQLMVRGVTTSLTFPLAFFPTCNLNADELNHLVWEAIECLEGIGCKVIAVVGDGAATNRKFFHMNTAGGTSHFCNNVAARGERRNLHFIFDAPHLMKTARNCFSKSGLPKLVKNKAKKDKGKTKIQLPPRRLYKNGKEILWAHIIEVYNIDSKNVTRKLPKLKFEHVYLDSYSRMRVKLATQVLSNSVANYMEDTLGDKASETVIFLRYMNKFFDTMNVANLTSGKRKRNANIEPFRSSDDSRLKVIVW